MTGQILMSLQKKAAVQTTWILTLPSLVHFYAFLDLSGSGTVRYARNVAKEEEGFFKGFILASLRISTPHHKGYGKILGYIYTTA